MISPIQVTWYCVAVCFGFEFLLLSQFCAPMQPKNYMSVWFALHPSGMTSRTPSVFINDQPRKLNVAVLHPPSL